LNAISYGYNLNVLMSIIPHFLQTRIPVQVNKKRPSFFSHNLKTPSTPANPDSKVIDVIPDAKVLN